MGRDDAILRAVHDQYRGIAIGRTGFGGECIGQGQVAGQGQQPGQRVGVTQPGVQGHGPALGKARQYDTPGRNAAFDFASDQRLDGAGRPANTAGVLAPGNVHIVDVVPGRHAHAAIDRHRLGRRMGKHETYAEFGRQAQEGHDRLEVVPVGTQAVQPDDAGTGGTGRGEFDAVQEGFGRWGVGHYALGSMGYFTMTLSINCRTMSIVTGWLVVRGDLFRPGPLLGGLLVAAMLLSGCGQKGDLYLPEPLPETEQPMDTEPQE